MDNNEGLSKKRHPFVELLVVTFFMLAVPFIVFVLLRKAMTEWTHYGPKLVFCQSETFAGLIGTAFAVMLIMSDVFNKPFKTVVDRWLELFDNIRYGLWSVGFRVYFDNIRENGLHFWWYLALIGFEVYLVLDGLRRFFDIVG